MRRQWLIQSEKDSIMDGIIADGWKPINTLWHTFSKSDYPFMIQFSGSLRIFTPHPKLSGTYLTNHYIGPCENYEELLTILKQLNNG